MLYHVIVSFAKDREYDFRIPESEFAGRSHEDARRWFDKEFSDLECAPSNPVGKVLIIDKILCVGRAGGEARFREGAGWAAEFARHAALALGRDALRIDIAAFCISY